MEDEQAKGGKAPAKKDDKKGGKAVDEDVVKKGTEALVLEKKNCIVRITTLYAWA